MFYNCKGLCAVRALFGPPKSKIFKSIENRVKIHQKASKILKQIKFSINFARSWKYRSSKVDEIEHFCKIPLKMPILGSLLALIIQSAHPYHPNFQIIFVFYKEKQNTHGRPLRSQFSNPKTTFKAVFNFFTERGIFDNHQIRPQK